MPYPLTLQELNMKISGRAVFLFCSIFAFFPLVLPGCATSGPPFVPESPEPDSALLYLYRESSMVGSGNHYLAAINGEIIARMKSGSYFVMRHPPGNILVSRKSVPAFGLLDFNLTGLIDGFVKTAQFEVKSGQRYFITFPAGELVTDEAQALSEMSGAELLIREQ
jgi:hypothetical protein